MSLSSGNEELLYKVKEEQNTKVKYGLINIHEITLKIYFSLKNSKHNNDPS